MAWRVAKVLEGWLWGSERIVRRGHEGIGKGSNFDVARRPSVVPRHFSMEPQLVIRPESQVELLWTVQSETMYIYGVHSWALRHQEKLAGSVERPTVRPERSSVPCETPEWPVPVVMTLLTSLERRSLISIASLHHANCDAHNIDDNSFHSFKSSRRSCPTTAARITLLATAT